MRLKHSRTREALIPSVDKYREESIAKSRRSIIYTPLRFHVPLIRERFCPLNYNYETFAYVCANVTGVNNFCPLENARRHCINLDHVCPSYDFKRYFYISDRNPISYCVLLLYSGDTCHFRSINSSRYKRY